MATTFVLDLNIGGPAAPPAIDRRWMLACHATLFLVVIFLLSTIRSGHMWGDDFAQYLQHAANIAHLRPYAETGYIYNPQNAILGPRAYPPGLPVALAPMTVVFGSNLNPFKVLNVALFAIALLIMARLFAHDLTPRKLWVWLVVVGFSSVYWRYKDSIASENLFIPLWYATLLVADDWYRRQKVYRNELLHGAVLGFLIYATCATRTVGVVLVPAVICCEVLIARRVTRVGLTGLVVAMSLIVCERFILPVSGSGYLEQLNGLSLKKLLSNAYQDTTAFSLIWQNLYWEAPRKLAGIVFALLAIVGFLRANLPKPTPLGIAIVGYFLLIVAWPSADGLRMVLPLLPAYVFYLLAGLNALRSIPSVSKAGTFALLLFSVVSYSAAYSATDFGPYADGVESSQAKELFEFVRSSTQPDETCLFFKPRALAMYTGRRASAYPLGNDEQEFWKYATDVDARLLIVREGPIELDAEDETCELRARFDLHGAKEVFHNSKFRAYRLTSPATNIGDQKRPVVRDATELRG